MMEFCGRSHDYFSRVKAADTNKIVGKLPGVAARRQARQAHSSISWRRRAASMNRRRVRAKFDQPRMLTPVVACRRRDVRDLRSPLS
jgi:hypothetical protein